MVEFQVDAQSENPDEIAMAYEKRQKGFDGLETCFLEAAIGDDFFESKPTHVKGSTRRAG